MTDKQEQLHAEKWVAIRELTQIGWALSQLSGSFEHTGNSKLAEELHLLAADLRNAVDTITGADAQILNIEVRESEQATANMLGAALASLTMGGKSDG